MVRRTSKSVEFPIDGLGSPSYRPCPRTTSLKQQAVTYRVLGTFNTMCCYFDTKTRKHEFINATTERTYLTTVLKKHPSDLVVMEACGPSGWIHDLATELGRKTIVCSTNEDAWKWSNVKRKTDKDDALKLTRMAASNELNPVHMPTPEKREWRSLIKFRKSLVHRVNRVRCSIRSLFVNHGITIDRTVKLWASGRESVNEYRKPSTNA